MKKSIRIELLNRLKLREGKSAFFNAKLDGRAARIQLEPIYKQNY